MLLKWILSKVHRIFFTNTPARTLSISGLKSRVLKLSFLSLKMMVKSGLEFILKFTEPLQRYLLSCQANSAILGWYFCTGQQQLWRGSVNFKINSRPLFTVIFKLKNDIFKTRDFSLLIERVLAGVFSDGGSSGLPLPPWSRLILNCKYFSVKWQMIEAFFFIQ